MTARNLVASVDAAVPRWCDYLGFEPPPPGGFVVDAWVLRDMAGARERGEVPRDLPPFGYGFARGQNVFVKSQPSDYYTRHLLIHEVFHAWSLTRFGGVGPAWFAEGWADRIATHRGDGFDLTPAWTPDAPESVPLWGRITRAAERYRVGRMPGVVGVLELPPTVGGDIDTYAAAWAMVTMLDSATETRRALIEAFDAVGDPVLRFNRRFLAAASEVTALEARWALWLDTLAYGIDPRRMVATPSTDDPVWDGGPADVVVPADRGWMTVGHRFAGGTRLRLTASGRATVRPAGDARRAWESEPWGLSIDFAGGRPVGRLLAAVVDGRGGPTVTPVEPIDVSDAATVVVPRDGWLALRVNDHPGGLRENTGEYRVRIEAAEG